MKRSVTTWAVLPITIVSLLACIGETNPDVVIDSDLPPESAPLATETMMVGAEMWSIQRWDETTWLFQGDQPMASVDGPAHDWPFLTDEGRDSGRRFAEMVDIDDDGTLDLLVVDHESSGAYNQVMALYRGQDEPAAWVHQPAFDGLHNLQKGPKPGVVDSMSLGSSMGASFVRKRFSLGDDGAVLRGTLTQDISMQTEEGTWRCVDAADQLVFERKTTATEATDGAPDCPGTPGAAKDPEPTGPKPTKPRTDGPNPPKRKSKLGKSPFRGKMKGKLKGKRR